MGVRYVDRIVGNVAHESKGGVNVGLKPEIEKQILKDAELLREGTFEEIHWHFWQGAQDDVLELLKQHGINYTVH